MSPDEPIEMNTNRVIQQANVAEASKTEQIQAINEYNKNLMLGCLRRKFRKEHYSEDGLEFREILMSTSQAKLRELGLPKGNRWVGKGDGDGLLGKLLMQLRKEIQCEENLLNGSPSL